MEPSSDLSQQESCATATPTQPTGFALLRHGAKQTGGFILLGLLIGAGAVHLNQSHTPAVTTAHVRLSFAGLERGEYPDTSRFQPDDLRRSNLLQAALLKQGLATSPEMITTVQNALSVEGIVPLQVVADRDRTRNTGQPVPWFTPDEYAIRLTESPALKLDASERAKFIEALVEAYQNSFRNTYGELPSNIGRAFERLKSADYVEYEFILNSEVRSIATFLSERLKQAKTFRSPSTGLSYKDLLEQTELFAQIQLNETLSLIREYGLSRDRELAMLKMQSALRLITEREHLALEQEALVKDLLSLTQGRAQSYVLGVTSDSAQTRTTAPLIERSMVESLIVNDAKNFLVREAMDAGLRVAAAQNDKLKIEEMRDGLRKFIEANESTQAAGLVQAQVAIDNLELNYHQLIDNIRKTQADFAQKHLGEAIRISRAPSTTNKLWPLILYGFFGAFLGFSLGCGLSLLGCQLFERKRA